MRSIFSDLDLVACDDYDVNNMGYTYKGLGTQSFIYNVGLFIRENKFSVIDDVFKCSDHCAIMCTLNVPDIDTHYERTITHKSANTPLLWKSSDTNKCNDFCSLLFTIILVEVVLYI